MNKEIANKWYKQALHDLSMAEKNIDIEGYDIASFLAHQSVEKLLKSIFALNEKKIPKTHYIDELARQLDLPEDLIENVYDLTADYAFSRYPDVGNLVPYEEYNEEIARNKVESAKKVFKYIKEKFKI